MLRHLGDTPWQAARLQMEDEFKMTLLDTSYTVGKFDFDEEGAITIAVDKHIAPQYRPNEYFARSYGMNLSEYVDELYYDHCSCEAEDRSDCDCDFSDRFDYQYGLECLSEQFIFNAGSPIVKRKEIVKIAGANKDILNHILQDIASEETTKLRFFGLLIKDGSHIINPLHPMMATLIESGDIKIPDTFTLMLYPISSEQTIEEGNFIEELQTVAALCTTVKTSAIVKADEKSKIIDITYTSKDIGGVQYEVEVNNSSESIAITPVQSIVTGGIVAPFYAMVESARVAEDSMHYSSKNIMKFRSANINTGYEEEFGGTCTGSEDSSKFESLRTLNRCNMGSPYHHDIIPGDWAAYVKACQQFSCSLILKGNENVEATSNMEQ